MTWKTKNNRSEGFVVIFALVILTTLLMASLALVSLLLPRLAVIREIAGSAGALYSADSVAEWCVYSQRKNKMLGYNTAADISAYANSANTQLLMRKISSSGGTTIGIGIYVKAPVNPILNKFKMAIYNDNGTAEPGALPTSILAATPEETLKADSWNVLNLSGFPISANTPYWIGYITNVAADTDNNAVYKTDTMASQHAVWKDSLYGSGFSDPFSAPTGSLNSNEFSMFVAYSDPTSVLASPSMANGATNTIFNDGTPATFCTNAEGLNYRVLGTYKGIVRSFQIFN